MGIKVNLNKVIPDIRVSIVFLKGDYENVFQDYCRVSKFLYYYCNESGIIDSRYSESPLAIIF